MKEKSRTSKLSSVEPDLKSKVGIKVTDQKSGGQYKVAETFCDRIVTVFSLFCRQKPVVDSFRTQVREHLVCDDLTFFQRAKNFVCWFRAYYLRQELPDVNGYSMSGPFRRWAFPRLRCSSGRGHNRRNDHLWNSFFLLKNCCLPVTDAKVMQELHGHYKGGPVPDTSKADDVSEMVDTLQPLLDEVAVKLRVAYDQLVDPDSWMDMYPASNKASTETPQSRGGEAMELYYLAFESTPRVPWVEAESWGFAGPLIPTSEARKMHDSKNIWNPEGSLERRLLLEKGLVLGPAQEFDRESGKFFMVMRVYDMSKPKESTFFWCDDEWGLTWYHQTPPYELAKYMPPQCEEFVYSDSYESMLHWVLNSETPVVEHSLQSVGSDTDWVISKSFPKSREVFRTFLKESLEAFPEHPMTKEQFDEALGKPRGWQGGYTLEESFVWLGPLARIVAVKEPLKVRVIGVGDAVMNFLSSWYQKTLHGILKEYPMFRLLGEAPVSTCVIDLYEGRAESVSWEELKAMSSDFKGASNQTPKAARDAILEACHRFLPDPIKRVNRFCNADHLLKYNWSSWWSYKQALKLIGQPCPKKPKDFQVSRQGTQMGTKTSFPILSLQVFGSFILACRRIGIVKSLADLYSSVLVNGDDLLALVSQSLHDKFWEVCGLLQFTKSVGKSYYHESYANINSQSYTFRVVEDSVTVRRTGALFCGLLMGQKKLATDTFDPTSVITALLDSCYDVQMERSVLKTFLGLHRKSVKSHACGRNLFISVGLGGCGQRKPAGWSSPVSDAQQLVASFFLSKGDLSLCQPTDPVLRAPPAPLASREVWDVRGLPTYWEQVRKLQDGDGEAKVPLSIDLWALANDRDFASFTGPLVKKQRLTSRVVRKTPSIPSPIEANDFWTCRFCHALTHMLVWSCIRCGHKHNRARYLDLENIGRRIDNVPKPPRDVAFAQLIQWDYSQKLHDTGHLSRISWDSHTEPAPVTRAQYSRTTIFRIGG